METQTVQKTIDIHADVSTVWKALTDPGQMQLWMSETPLEIISAWKPGSSFSIRGKMNGKAYQSKGTILKLETNRYFRYSYWNEISEIPDIPENYSILDFSLSAKENLTTLTFMQHNFKGEATFEHARFFWNVALVVMKNMIEKNTY